MYFSPQIRETDLGRREIDRPRFGSGRSNSEKSRVDFPAFGAEKSLEKNGGKPISDRFPSMGNDRDLIPRYGKNTHAPFFQNSAVFEVTTQKRRQKRPAWKKGAESNCASLDSREEIQEIFFPQRNPKNRRPTERRSHNTILRDLLAFSGATPSRTGTTTSCVGWKLAC